MPIVNWDSVQLKDPSMFQIMLVTRETARQEAIKKGFSEEKAALSAYVAEVDKCNFYSQFREHTIAIVSSGLGLIKNPYAQGGSIFIARAGSIFNNYVTESCQRQAAQTYIGSITTTASDALFSPDDLWNNETRDAVISSPGIAAGLQARNALISQGLFRQLMGDIAKNATDQTDLTNKLELATKAWKEHATSQAKNLESLSEDLGKLGMDVQAFVESVQENQNKNIAANTLTHGKLQEITSDTNLLKEIMLGRLTPSEQLKLYKEKKLDHGVDPAQLKKLELIVNLQSFQEKAAKYINGSRQIIELAENLGLSHEKAQQFKKAFDVGESIVNAGMAIANAATGNPMGYIAAANILFGAFGGQSSQSHTDTVVILDAIENVREEVERTRSDILLDIAAFRDSMDQQFNSVKLNQTVIQESLNKVASTQQITLNLVSKIYTQISELHNVNQKQSALALKKINELRDSSWIERQMLAGIQLDKLDPCRSFLDRRHQYKFKNGVFPNYDSMCEFFNDKNLGKKDFIDAYEGFRNLLTPGFDDNFDPTLYTSSSQKYDALDIDGQTDTYIRLVAHPLIRVLNHAITNKLITPAQFAIFFDPPKRTNSLNLDPDIHSTSSYAKALERSGGLNGPLYPCRFMLNPKIILAIGEYLLEFTPYIDLVDDPSSPTRLRTLEELKEDNSARVDSFILLGRLNDVIDIAIMQQSLLSGGALLPIISTLFVAGYGLFEVATMQETIKQRKAALEEPQAQYKKVLEDIKEQENRITAHSIPSIDEMIKNAEKDHEDCKEKYIEIRTKTLINAGKSSEEANKLALDEVEKLTEGMDSGAFTAEEMKYVRSVVRAGIRKDRLLSENTNAKFLREMYQNIKGQLKKQAEELESHINKQQTDIADLEVKIKQWEKIADTTKAVKSTDSTRINQFQLTIDALKFNKILQRNFIIVMVTNALARTRKSLNAYHLALGQSSKQHLLDVLKLPIDLVLQKPEGGNGTPVWHLSISDTVKIPMPTYSDIRHGFITPTQELVELEELRLRIATKMNEYLIPKPER